MSNRILGLDLGTNSIGWAVVETENKQHFQLLDKGVRIFQEGVKIEKGVEGSKAAERTGYRSARRIKYRRKLRKINTLTVLTTYDYCPPLIPEMLNQWRYKKIYPASKLFKEWWLTDEATDKNPYAYRALAAEQKLDLTNRENRYKLGRAFYHMVQRRGFLSNRLEGTKESEGAVKQGIKEISEAIGNQTLGQYFYQQYRSGEKIRDHYTHREAHYLAEFTTICQLQELPTEMVAALKKAIFYQRPLKSQKGLVGKCPFEPNKTRCAVSHPLFEEFRMWCFVNNIKIKLPEDEKLRFLTPEEKAKILPQFFRKSKEHFDFEDIAKQLAPKKQYCYYKQGNKHAEDWLFNYSMKTTVSGCPVSARFKSLFGDHWAAFQKPYTREKDGQSSTIDINDVWHVLFTYDSDEKLQAFARERLELDDDQTKEFVNIHLKQDYGSLSLKAIKKILPYLREGLIYSHAVFLGNMKAVIPAEVWAHDENKTLIRQEIGRIIQSQNEEKHITDIVNGAIKRNKESDATWSAEASEIYRKELLQQIKSFFGENRFNAFSEDRKQRLENRTYELFEQQMEKDYGRGKYAKVQRIDDRITLFLSDNFGVNGTINHLYHPSALDVYQPPKKGEDGNYYLASPMVASVRNPMAMRALHQLRKVINELLKAGKIDASTAIHIEMARDLMNANERKALQSWQRDRENLRKSYAAAIKTHLEENGIHREATDDEILKYQLWEEQKHICLYTGQTIGLHDFLGANPLFDIEHTIPQSLSFDNSQANKTLCESRFNRATKRNKIPFELSNHAAICERIESWQKEVEELNKKINGAVRQAKGAATKEDKDKAIQRRHRLTIERDYKREKYQRFTMKDVPTGFKNSQLVDTGIITKYARLYLKTLFKRVDTVKGNTVADFRKIWGLQEAYNKKQRVNHIHHCIDAITIACMTKPQYDKLARFYHDWEEWHHQNIDKKPVCEKPWRTFTEDVKAIEQEVFISHYTPDNLPKANKKKLRKRGKIQLNDQGQPIYQTGDSVRGSLHKETFYGATEQETETKKGEKEKVVKYVVRKPLDSLSDADIKNVVDDKVREILQQARKNEKGLQKQWETLKKKLAKAEEADEPAIRREMQTIEQEIKQLYCLPNKNGAPVPIKKVRVFTPTVTKPIPLKKQRDQSLKEHKRDYHVANDGNYLMAIYEGKDAKGKVKRDFKIVNNYDAGNHFRDEVQKTLRPQGIGKQEGLVEKEKQKGKLQLPLKAIIKTGTIVLFWKNTPEEIKELSEEDLIKRLYKVIKMNKDGRVAFKYHQEARNDEKLKEDYEKKYKTKAPKSLTNGESSINFETPYPKLLLSPLKFNMLIEGIDFTLSPLGEIK
ncbi:type II CRISPR RNA-guided endonuclease Cas9 [Marinilabiliaceae bacterium JC017]|nr:type II CRISPR RNA-guided endonuclease Cas9 [Marinilabiliaceae bacterium JC017]